MQAVQARRSGFTLIEILVVLAIIGILAALTLSAMNTVVDSQRQSNTEDLIRTITKTFDQQYKAVIDKADKDPLDTIPLPIRTMALANVGTGVIGATPTDLRRMRVIWKKFLLRKEFPTTFDEARQPHLPMWTAPGPPGSPTAATPPGPPNAMAVASGNLTQFFLGTAGTANFPPNPSYVRALGATPSSALDSAVLLLLSLEQNRGGVSLNADKLPSGRVVTNAANLKQITDYWGQPIVYTRFPLGDITMRNAVGPAQRPRPTGDLDAAMPGRKAPPYNATSRTGEYGRNDHRDPLDPEGLLLDPAWNNATNLINWQGVYWFEWYVHPVHVWPNPNPKNPTTYTQVGIYNIPVMLSAGRNMQLGVDANLNVIAGQANAANDNIYSWRLRLGVKTGN